MARVIFHIDINAFFASAEVIKDPTLKDLPVAVGSMSRRGVLSTANYVARQYGVHSAMPVYEALEKCPELVIVDGDYQYYRALSGQFFDYLHTYTQQIEPASIDECYMDVTEIIQSYKRPLDLAVQIQNGVKDKVGLDVSIGVAPTKFLAKMASDMRKPRGITVLRKSELEQKLYPLPVGDIVGIGKKTVPVLLEHKIETIGDFANPDNESFILKTLGKNGYHLLRCVHGQSSNTLHYTTSRKSISMSRTYQQDIFSLDEVKQKIQVLVHALAQNLQSKNTKGKLVSISLRNTEFHTIVRSQTLAQYTNVESLILETAIRLIEENFEPVGYRLLGVSVGSLKVADQIIEQPTIFQTPVQDTNDILSTLNKKMDGIHLMKASDLLNEENENG